MGIIRFERFLQLRDEQLALLSPLEKSLLTIRIAKRRAKSTAREQWSFAVCGSRSIWNSNLTVCPPALHDNNLSLNTVEQKLKINTSRGSTTTIIRCWSA